MVGEEVTHVSLGVQVTNAIASVGGELDSVLSSEDIRIIERKINDILTAAKISAFKRKQEGALR